ncbi:MAG: 4-(cytidine 5'-diphospho)-2-C-methyl-D-erythritol kinase [Candidatus Omnitrophica bacterium]|nr:4-(cytidine 5'-diphospho)-2-C-methyl-D-erythritol kinase [Candidatus Omnitrophota bacterium]
MKQSSSVLAIKSFAKLNLYLQVLNKRKDNFHNLSTLFARIDLADTLTFRKRSDSLIKIKCDSRQVPKDKANLCYRAAALLKQELKLSLGIEIELKKRIPVGAGLGGGSSNAASVLLGLNRFWNLNLSRTRLVKLGAKLGSDVPFFIYQAKFALGSQRGDKIKPLISLNKLKLWFILVYPNIKVSTPWIYQKFDVYFSAGRTFSRLTPHLARIQDGKKLNKKQGAGLTRPGCNVKILTSQLLKKGKVVDTRCLFNGLEVITSNLYPVVKQVKNALFGIGLDKVMMSGSGPAVFAICDSCMQAQSLRRKLCKQYKSWKVFVVSCV